MALVLHEYQERENWEAGCVDEEFLFVGSLSDAQNVARLRQEGITHVLTVASRLKVWVDDKDTALDPPEGITHLRVNLDDHPRADLLSVLPECLNFLHGALGKTWPPRARGRERSRPKSALLVHCASGISRSVAVTAAFLMTTAGMSLDDALVAIRRNRPHARPNIGFQFQLQCLEKAGGDIVAATGLYKEELRKEGTEDIADVMRRQRHTANMLHSRVDEAEEMLAALAKSGGAPPGHPVWRELTSCVDMLDRENSRAEGYSDKPAAVIRRSACSKANRLLEGRQTQN